MKARSFIYILCAACTLLAAPHLAAESAALDDTACPNIAGFKIIGEVENVTLKSKDLRLKARIDTGAQTSSLGVASQQPFERDGRKWLRFSVKIPGSGNTVEFEEPVVRSVKIKRHGAEGMERPVVKLQIMLGNLEMKKEFTLADRSQYEFPVLIGRNVLGGKYLVDVNRKYSGKRTAGKEE